MSDQIRLQTLLSATSRQDERAFAKLYELTSANLFAVAMRILKKEAAAEDALQDAFVQIWHRAADFHVDKGSPMTWMASIVRYRALDIIRRNKNTSSIEETELEQVDKAMGPLGNLLESDMAKAVWDCLQDLNDSQRSSILLAFYEGLTHEELAKRVMKPLGTIKSWIRRGLQQLKGCLE